MTEEIQAKKKPGRKNLFGEQQTVEIKLMMPTALWDAVKKEAAMGERPATAQARIFLKRGLKECNAS